MTQILQLVVVMFVALFGLSSRTHADNRNEPEMTVVIVRSIAANCEPVCAHWISAEGRITAATPNLFKSVIARLGKQKMAVLIQSGGGDVDAAVSIGRMIRKAGLDVTVAVTSFVDQCSPKAKKCKLPPEQMNVYSGLGTSSGAYCNSACSLVLAAGVNRPSDIGAVVGVHQVLTNWVKGDQIFYRETYRIVNKKKKVISRKIVKRIKGKSYTTSGLYKGLRKKLAAYLNEMGVDLALFTDMDKAPPSSIYWMPIDELRRIKLVNSSSKIADYAGLSACRKYPLPSFCVFKISKS